MSSISVNERYELKLKKHIVKKALSLIGLSIIAGNMLAYCLATYGLLGIILGSSIGALIGVIGNYFLLVSQTIGKIVEVETGDKVGLKDTVNIKVSRSSR